MRVVKGPATRVTAFAYECENTNLAFFDFVSLYLASSDYSPSLICVLNKNLFGFAMEIGTHLVPHDQPNQFALPVMYETGEDSLLVYVHYLSQWISSNTDVSFAYYQYTSALFDSLAVFHFDADFISLISSDVSLKEDARNSFLRTGEKPMSEVYNLARSSIGLESKT